jgi:hypothetical protein
MTVFLRTLQIWFLALTKNSTHSCSAPPPSVHSAPLAQTLLLGQEMKQYDLNTQAPTEAPSKSLTLAKDDSKLNLPSVSQPDPSLFFWLQKGKCTCRALACQANKARFQTRVPDRLLSPPSPPSRSTLNFNRAFGSLICQQPAPGGPRSLPGDAGFGGPAQHSAPGARPGVPGSRRAASPPRPRSQPALGAGDSRGERSRHPCYLLPPRSPNPCTRVPPGRPRTPRAVRGGGSFTLGQRDPRLPQGPSLSRPGLRGSSTILLTGQTPEGQQLHLLLLRGL